MRINEAHSSLIATYTDWSDVLYNPRFIRKKNTLSWDGYKPQSKEKSIHKSYVSTLIEEHQYTFKIYEDDSIIQIFYHYTNDGASLLHANLAYYGNRVLPECGELQTDATLRGDERSTETCISREELPFDQGIINHDPLVPWLRIDYSPEKSNGPLHHDCHMHICLLKDARIPISGVPSPRQFVEFIMALCYPDHYREKRLNKNAEPINLSQMRGLNRDCFNRIDSTVYEILPYLNIPTTY